MIVLIPLNLIHDNPWQTRRGAPDPAYVKELAIDIAQNGLMQHPVGRLLIDDRPVDPQPYVSGVGAFYAPAGVVQLAFGHNRRAAYAWLKDVQPTSNIPGDFSALPVDLRILTDEQMADYAWSENEKRRDHSPHERALAIQRRQADFGWTQAQIAEHLGLSRSAIANMLRLLKLPEDVLAALAEGRISERVAMALVSLFDLPQSMRDQAENGYNSNRPSNIVQRAMSGEYTSDTVRKETIGICNTYGRNLDDAIWKIDDVLIVENVHSPVCKTCPARLADRNLCMDPKCYRQKESHAKSVYIETASLACGIPPLEGNKSVYDTTRFDRWHHGDKLSTVRSAGCENLRLAYQSLPDNTNLRDLEQTSRIQNYPNAMVVCCKREQFCTCLNGLKYQKAGGNGSRPAIAQDDNADEPPAPAQTAEDLKELARAARAEKKAATQDAKELLRETAERIAAGLTQRNRSTWRKLAQAVTYKANGLEDHDLWAIQLMIATKMAEQSMPYEINTYQDVMDRMNRLLSECGLEQIALPDHDYTLPAQEERLSAGKTLMDVFEDS